MKFPTFMETRGSLPCSQNPPLDTMLARWILSTSSDPISINIYSSSHLRLSILNGLFRSGFPTKILFAFFISRIRDSCPSHLIFLNLITAIIFGEELKLWNFSVCSFFLSSCSYSISFRFNILLSTLFCNTFPPYSSFNLKYTVSHTWSLSSAEVKEWVELYLHSPTTSSWRGA
jgi:hypothetical protein